MAFDLADYETVEDRLIKFWEGYPDGRIETELLIEDGTHGYIVKARIFRKSDDTRFWTSGLAQENVTEKGVNSTSALENCETSAIGRALANAGFAAKGKRASREEMAKVKQGETVEHWGNVEKKVESSSWSDKTNIGRKIANVASGDTMPSIDLSQPPFKDPWDKPFDPGQEIVDSAGEGCIHGDRTWRTGKNKEGKSWGGFFCPTPKGTQGQCGPIWYSHDDALGEWVRS